MSSTYLAMSIPMARLPSTVNALCYITVHWSSPWSPKRPFRPASSGGMSPMSSSGGEPVSCSFDTRSEMRLRDAVSVSLYSGVSNTATISPMIACCSTYRRRWASSSACAAGDAR